LTTNANQAPDEVTALRELVSSLQKENSLLRQKIDALCRRVFGSSSEKIDAAQLELLLQLVNSGPAIEAQPAPAVGKTVEPVRPRKERSPRVPENLPVVEQVIEPQEVVEQPEQWRLIGQEVSEQLDYEPARFLRRRIIRKKYVHVTDPDRAPIRAPTTPRSLFSAERRSSTRACAFAAAAAKRQTSDTSVQSSWQTEPPSCRCARTHPATVPGAPATHARALCCRSAKSPKELS
jgi:hypothetical protein